jgi:hypothetical protein
MGYVHMGSWHGLLTHVAQASQALQRQVVPMGYAHMGSWHGLLTQVAQAGQALQRQVVPMGYVQMGSWHCLLKQAVAGEHHLVLAMAMVHMGPQEGQALQRHLLMG